MPRRRCAGRPTRTVYRAQSWRMTQPPGCATARRAISVRIPAEGNELHDDLPALRQQGHLLELRCVVEGGGDGFRLLRNLIFELLLPGTNRVGGLRRALHVGRFL